MQGECELCGKYGALHRHHIFMGHKQRKTSEKYGAVIYLCITCHGTGKTGIHGNSYICKQVQEQEQRRLMRKHEWTVQDFIRIFGRNYI